MSRNITEIIFKNVFPLVIYIHFQKKAYKVYTYTYISIYLSRTTLKVGGHVLYEQCLKVTGTTAFKKRFPKLDYKSSISYNDS